MEHKPIKASEIAALTNGNVEGSSEESFYFPAKIEQATKGTLSFLSNPKYEEHLYTTQASVILINNDIHLSKPVKATLVKVSDAYLAFCQVLNVYFNAYTHRTGIHEKSVLPSGFTTEEGLYIGAGAVIEEGVKLGKNVKIYPNCYIGTGSNIGDNTVLYSGVNVYYDSKIGKNCIIHSGCVIGSDGFGHAPQKDGTYVKIPQIGNVIIEDDVELGANCTIDRATLGSTVIKKGTRLDNLIQIAHNVVVGENTVIAAQTGVSGSVTIGNNCVIGGQVGFVGHIKIADGTQIGAQSGISKDVTEPSQQWIGSPIQPLREAFKTQVVYRNLPALKARIEQLEKELKELKQRENE